MKLILRLTLGSAIFCFSLSSLAQNQDSTVLNKYKLPYKDTYVKDALVAENEFRVMKPEIIKHGTFEKQRIFYPIQFGPVMKKR